LYVAGLHEYLAVTSWIFQAPLVPTTICTARLQLCKDLVLAATSSVAACPIAARWNIVLQIESNRRRTVYRARLSRQPGDTAIAAPAMARPAAH
jgi:hypothetical protein